MMADIHQEDGLGHWAGREAVECFLPEDEIRKLNRDLRILIASNGTLTRTLGIVADDEVVVQIVEQHVQVRRRNIRSGAITGWPNSSASDLAQRSEFGSLICRCGVVGCC